MEYIVILKRLMDIRIEIKKLWFNNLCIPTELIEEYNQLVEDLRNIEL